MARNKREKTPIPIESITHEDKRANIPTKELRDFVVDDEKAPQTTLYPRDPSLDPQLVWQGKDEQDAEDLEVESVPIYIQEKIYPQAIIEDVRRQSQMDNPDDQLDFFSDFNGIEFKDLIDFYQHEQNWTNRMILGDSLLVMNSLAEKEGLRGQVQMIYIDPPYGIKFGSNWQVSTRKRDVKDGKAEDVTRQPEQIKAFRDTWELHIHSYLSYLRDRLVVARELLTESGSIFVQIGDENVHLVRCLMDEVFGARNFISQITFSKTTGQTSKLLAPSVDFLLWYAKDIEQVKYRQLHREKSIWHDQAGVYRWLRLQNGAKRRMSRTEVENPTELPNECSVFRISDIRSQSGGDKSAFAVSFEGNLYVPSPGFWKTNQEGIKRLILSERIIKSGKSLGYIRFIDDFPAYPFTNYWVDTGTGSFTENKVYVVQTSVKVITRCLLMTTDPGDLVLDPTCGSGTTAYVAEGWGRRWITVDTSRVALALARTRLMSARYPYYILADSPEGVKKEAALTGDTDRALNAKTSGDIKKGFVYERVPHITLKLIANNPEIDEIHAKWQEQLEPLRAEINRLADKDWEEWEIPRPENVKESEIRELKSEIEKWWKLRQERQQKIDATIARHSDTEFLYDKPYEDKKRIRVTGPFTVESLSPHRVYATDEDLSTADVGAKHASPLPFETTIIENLKKAGVQNTVKNERLKFDWLESGAGEWIHAEGEYTENGETKRVAVCIGPEHGTVGPELIKEAAKEAVRGLGFDLLIVCGFAFDPHVSEERTRYGKLTVLIAHMNPDLAMGDELLKKTGAGNLFTVFGEPDVKIERGADGVIIVEILGLDVYDPTTGMVRPSSTDDIACWFIDTNYNGESFFVRHAYFTGSNTDKPYDKLKRALRAEIDEAAWATLYRTKSRPFDSPESGKIAVKVINHYGDEVLKVYDKSHWEKQ